MRSRQRRIKGVSPEGTAAAALPQASPPPRPAPPPHVSKNVSLLTENVSMMTERLSMLTDNVHLVPLQGHVTGMCSLMIIIKLISQSVSVCPLAIRARYRCCCSPASLPSTSLARLSVWQ